MLTESRNPRTEHIDALPTLDVVRLINEEDARVAPAVAEALPQIARAVDVVVDCLRSGGRVFYVGAGTSGRLAVLDAVELVPTFGAPPDLVVPLIAGGTEALTRSIEGAEDRADWGRRDLVEAGVRAGDVVVGLAASGTTPYVLGAVEAAREVGAVTVGVCCNASAPLLEAVDIPIAVLVGPEVITGSTRMKAGTAQKMVLNTISTAAMIRMGKVYGNLMVDVQVTNAKLARRARNIVSQVTGLEPAEAEALLDRTGNEVKTAIVVGLLGLSPEEARRRLAAAGGVLRGVIGDQTGR
ncbi:MAG: N-acetylmuramic acid 6-phosphate etherase [Anaerolineae bacterium]|nr:N-acetylmuramic acid 6-phosphate etherase [Anaerolineae bacterium]